MPQIAEFQDSRLCFLALVKFSLQQA